MLKIGGTYFVLLSLICFYFVSGQQDPTTSLRCISGSSTWYVGTVNVTEKGILCQRWDVNVPHKPRRTPRDGGHHNYCRNPDNDPLGTWCYTTNSSVRWQHCDIPKCPDDSLLLITSRKSPNRTWIFQTPADPELSVNNITNLKAVLSFAGNNYIWAVTADKRGKRVIYADYRANSIGIYSFETNTTTTKFPGMVAGVEEMAYDWVTSNLYWADSYKNWIMATDKNFERTTVVYKNATEAPYGVTLHAKLRLLFFSTKKGSQSTIKRSDLAGRNVEVIYSANADIRTLALDYTDDRIYWASNLAGSRSAIMSCNTDGTNRTLHSTLTRTRVWGITAYLNTIYLADQADYYHFRRGFYYKLKLLPKDRGLPRVISYPAKMKALAIYSKNEEFSIDEASPDGTCNGMPTCDHICLPTNTTRVCACSVGYVKSGDTGCKTVPITDNFMVFADVVQKAIFKISLLPGPLNYTAVPIGSQPDISAMAMNLVNKNLYWYDRKMSALYKSSNNGSGAAIIRRGLQVQSMAIDHITGNIYYADANTGNIYIMDGNARYVKTLLRQNSSQIQALALDIDNKFVYWIYYNGTDKGELWRMKFNGANPSLLVGGLTNPGALFIDDPRSLVYITTGRKGTILYEISKSSLNSASGTLPSDRTRFDLPGVSTTSKVIDIYEDNSVFYYSTKPRTGISRVNLTDRVLINRQVVNDFYEPRFFSVFHSDRLRILFIDGLLDPCVNLSSSCANICIRTSNITRECACGDGEDQSGINCGEVPPETLDGPPTHGGTCSNDILIQAPHCVKSVLFTPSAPQWTDDNTDVEDLILNNPTFQLSYNVGVHPFSYTARDSAGNVGYCRFTLTVTSATCPLPSSINHTKFKVENPTCIDGEQGFYISCSNTSLNIAYGDTLNGSLWNECQPRTNRYIITDLNHLDCLDPTKETTTASSTVSVKATGTPKGVPTQPQPQPASAGLSTGAIAAIVVILILAVVIAAVVVVFRYRRQKHLHISGAEGDTNPIFSWAKTGAADNQNTYQKF